MRRLISVFLIAFFLIGATTAFAEDKVCFSVSDASNMVVELEQKRVLDQEIKEYQALTQNLKDQNEALAKQNSLLKEQVELQQTIANNYKNAYNECVSHKKPSIGDKVQYFIMGAGLGIAILVLL
jgi:prophage DNA circulation protein